MPGIISLTTVLVVESCVSVSNVITAIEWEVEWREIEPAECKINENELKCNN